MGYRAQPPGSMARRDRLRRERERRILEAAATIFARKGFHRATIREIAELADVADGTIYNYYANKQDLLVAMTRHVISDSARDALAPIEGEDEREFLTVLLTERFSLLEQNSDFFRVMMAEMWTNEAFRHRYLDEVVTPLIEVLEEYLRARIKAGTLRQLNTSIVVRAMAGSFLTFVLLSQAGYGSLQLDVSYDELIEELVDFFLLGLQSQPVWERDG